MNCGIVDEFASTLIGEVPAEYIDVVRRKMNIFFYDFDVRKTCTAVSTDVIQTMPEEVKKYIATLTVDGYSKRTTEKYYNDLKLFFSSCMKQVESVRKDDIIYYLSMYKEKRGVSARTIDALRISLSAFFSWCSSNDIIEKNPCKGIKPIKYVKTKEAPLTDFQIESLRTNCKCLRDIAIVDFLLSTGCRISETLNIRISDINFTEQKLTVLGKGNKYRTVYINGKSAYSLNKYLESRGNPDPSEYLFVTLRKPYRKLTKDAIELMLKKLGTASGVGRVHPHLFRKTMSTSALRKGMDITIVQKVLGHANIETTMGYVTVNEEDVENAHRRFVS